MAKKSQPESASDPVLEMKSLDLEELIDYVPDISHKWMVIGIKLGQNSLVKQLQDSRDSEETKCIKVLQAWMDGNTENSRGKLLSVLKSKAVNLGNVAEKLGKNTNADICASDHDPTLENKQGGIGNEMSLPFAEMREQLKLIQENPHGLVWKKETEKNKKLTEVLDTYFQAHLNIATDVQDIEGELAKLYDKNLLPLGIMKKAWFHLSQLEKHMSRSASVCSEEELTSPVIKEELFSKDNIYHATLCCEALETDNPTHFFSTCSHSFEALSQSRIDCNNKHGPERHGRYIIAKKRNTYFVAFKGICDMAAWKEYTTFDDGIQRQADCIPANYFVELLKDNAQLIFVGFSLGGSLACAVLANLLRDNLLNQDTIVSSLACITFGQPVFLHIALDAVVSDREALGHCFHYVYMEDDLLPMLLRYFFIQHDARSLLSEASTNGSVENSASIILDWLANLQGGIDSTVSHKQKKKTKEKLKVLLPQIQSEIKAMNQDKVKEGKPPLPPGQYYYIYRGTTSDGDTTVTNLMWEALPRAKSIALLSRLSEGRIMSISEECFKKHSPEEYRKPVFYSYLDKPQVDSPPYSLPSANKELDSQVVNLEPKMSSVEIHCYDEEICIIVSGDNLWFSRDAQVLKWSVCTTLSKNTNLQFQALVTGQQIQPTELPQVVTIRLGTCFSQYVMEKSVAVTVKNYAVSIRQAQIARLVPAELIEVAMLSAALERRGDMGDGPLLYSERYHAVMNFFLTALEVVPIESVAKALRIAHVLLPHWEQYGLELLLSFEGKLPPSTFFKTDLLIYLSSLGSFRNLTKDGRKQLDKIVGYMAKSPASARVISEKSIKMLFNRAPPTLNPLVMLENTSEKIDHLLWDQEILTASPQHIKKDSTNVDVLSLIKELRLSAVNFGFLTDSFMSSQVQIPLVKSPENTARAIDSSDDSVGVWYLVGLNFVKMSKVLKKNKKLVIDVIDYLGKILPEKQKRAASYSAKLQFIDQAMSDTVSCSSQFVGYSLERQLKEMCEGCGITAETTIGQICHDWDNFFAKKILSYVASTFRPLIARWIKWMLAVHELREALASQTIIGVVGLMNSGKSTLLNRIFCQKVPSGTSEAKRTTVPFLYSLGPDVEGVDVIDFPGVDDNDDLIRVLCKILFDLAQVAVFVVEYKNGHSLASMMWLKNIIQSQRIPILICLTHADKLYAEHITGGKYPTLEIALGVVEDYRKEFLLKVEKECGGTPPDCKMCTLALDKDSMLANKEGRRRLKDAGIQGPEDIARWIIDVLNRRGQCEIAENLKKFFKLPH